MAKSMKYESFLSYRLQTFAIFPLLSLSSSDTTLFQFYGQCGKESRLNVLTHGLEACGPVKAGIASL